MSHDPFVVKESVGVEEGDDFIAPIEERSDAQRFPVSSPRPRDRAWAIAFKINVAITVISALWFGRGGIQALSSPEMLYGRRLSEDASDGGGGWPLTFFFVLAMVGLAWAICWGMLMVLINCSKKILQVAFLGACVMWAVATVGTLASGQVMIAMICCVFLALSIMFYSYRQGRIRFAGENLKVAAMAIKSMPWTVRSALLMSVFQVLWAALISVAAAGTVAALETVHAPGGTEVYRALDCHNAMLQNEVFPSCVCRGEVVSYNSACSYGGRSATLILFWLATLLWSGEVVRNVVAATVTGSIASWWYTPHDPKPVLGAFYRATGSSLGSLCKASAITGTIRMLRLIARRYSRARCLIRLVLACVQAAVDYAVAYTVCFIGIYGLSFSEAGSRVGKLFHSRGVTTIANDNVVGIGLSLLAVAATVVYIMAAFLLCVASSYASHLTPWVTGSLVIVCLFSVYGFLAGVIVISTTLEVVLSGFKAVFVCFMQDPDVLATNHNRQLHEDLSRAWQKMQREYPRKPNAYLREVEQA